MEENLKESPTRKELGEVNQSQKTPFKLKIFTSPILNADKENQENAIILGKTQKPSPHSTDSDGKSEKSPNLRRSVKKDKRQSNDKSTLSETSKIVSYPIEIKYL